MPRHRVQPARNWGASAIVEANGEAGTDLVSSPPSEAEGAPPVRLVAGRQATVSRVMRVISSERLDLIRKAVGVAVIENQAKLAAVVNAMDGIAEQTDKVLKASVEIGRELNAMLDELSEEEGRAALRNSVALFAGWSAGNLRKMMGAARIFDSGWVDREILPTSFTTLYELSHLDEVGMRRAVEGKLIRPTLSRNEAESIWKLVALQTDAPANAGLGNPTARAALPREVIEIDAEVDALRAEIKRLASRRSRLMAKAARDRRRAATTGEGTTPREV